MKKFLLSLSTALLLSAAGNFTVGQAYKNYAKKPAPAKKPAAVAVVTPAASAAPAAPSVVSIAIVSSSLPNAKGLIKGLDSSVKVFVVRDQEAVSDLFKRITLKCEKSNEMIGAIAVFSHGKSGEFLIGADKISPRNLKFIGEDFEMISPRLAADPKLMIFASEAGYGKNGDKLMTSLADLFPGSIYMSDNTTGMGGDWNLEISNTDTPAPVVVNTEYLDKYYKFTVGK